MTLYEQMARCVQHRISEGVYPLDWVEGRERSGFFVLHRHGPPETAGSEEQGAGPATVSGQSTTLALLRASSSARFGRLGVAMPDPSYLPMAPLQRAFRQSARWRRGDPTEYSFPPPPGPGRCACRWRDVWPRAAASPGRTGW